MRAAFATIVPLVIASGVATVNAEESLQRAMSEAHGDASAIAPALALLTYTRRFTASVAALALTRHAPERAERGALEGFRVTSSGIFEALALAAEAGVTLPAVELPQTEQLPALSPVVRARMERLSWQLGTLAGTVRRLSGAAADYRAGDA